MTAVARDSIRCQSIASKTSQIPSDEEAYASLPTLYLATQIERAIRSLTALQTRQKAETESTFLGPAIARRRHLPHPDPTHDNHCEDDRWERITSWAVQEALEWLRDNGRVWWVSEVLRAVGVAFMSPRA